jgi:hypothetical protein
METDNTGKVTIDTTVSASLFEIYLKLECFNVWASPDHIYFS